MEIIYAEDEPQPDRFADAGYQETMAKVDAFLAAPETGFTAERGRIDKDAILRQPPVDSLLHSGARERITWDDVQAVYPDIPLEDLQKDLEAYKASLEDLAFEVVTEGSWVDWSNEQQRFIACETPDFWPFSQGGILLIMAGSTREPFGPGRKTSKWFVGTEVFRTYAEALELSERVKAAPPVGHGDPSDYAEMLKL